MSTDSAHGEALPSAVRIEITGRAGVGRSSIVAALGSVAGAELVETDALDRPGFPDPVLTGEIVVLVVLDPPRAVDVAVADEATDRLLPVLAKTDTLTDPDGALARAGAALHETCLPVSTRGARTGLPRLREALEDRVRTVRAARAVELLDRLGSAQGLHAPGAVDDFLAGDAGIRLAAQATGLADPPGDARSRARYWRARMNTTDTPDALRAALAMHRDAVREWMRGA